MPRAGFNHSGGSVLTITNLPYDTDYSYPIQIGVLCSFFFSVILHFDTAFQFKFMEIKRCNQIITFYASRQANGLKET